MFNLEKISTFMMRRSDPQISFEPTESPRLVVDFTGTRSPRADAPVAADVDEARFDTLLRRARSGVVIEVFGLHLLPESAEAVARRVAKARRGSRASLILRIEDAPTRWKRRFTGNLVRFGCIETHRGISG